LTSVADGWHEQPMAAQNIFSLYQTTAQSRYLHQQISKASRPDILRPAGLVSYGQWVWYHEARMSGITEQSPVNSEVGVANERDTASGKRRH